jgi:CheY-like chemotaxis protein
MGWRLSAGGEPGPVGEHDPTAPVFLAVSRARRRYTSLVATNSLRSNVLIVEDDPEIREALAEFLGLEGYSVIEAGNGLEGLDRLAQGTLPCIILLDMMMPEMSGAEFLTRVQADPVLRDCTVLVMTASFLELPPGAMGMIRKPFELPDLLELVNRHCSQVRGADRSA